MPEIGGQPVGEIDGGTSDTAQTQTHPDPRLRSFQPLAQSGCQFRFVPAAIGWHYSRRSLTAWLQVARSYGDCDRRLDAMYPEMHWLTQVERELSRRHPVLRFVRSACPPAARSALAFALGAVSPPLDALGGTRLARGALSVAYELEYLAGLESSHGQPTGGARPASFESGVK